MQDVSWEPLPQRQKKRSKLAADENTKDRKTYNTEIEDNIRCRSERTILPGTLVGMDGVRNEFYEC